MKKNAAFEGKALLVTVLSTELMDGVGQGRSWGFPLVSTFFDFSV